MSEAPDQPVEDVAASAVPAGVEAEVPAATTDDIETEAFDRMPAPADDAEDAPEGQAEGEDGEDKPAAAEDPETFEVEVGGQKIQVPKALEPLLLFQKDYTQKTQALAEERRVVETKAEALAAQEAQQAASLKEFRAEHTAIGQFETGIAGIDAKLAEYAKISPDEWAALRTNKPEEYEAHRAQRQLLRDTKADYAEALAKAQEDLKTKETALTERQLAARTEGLAKAWEATNARLAKDIPSWSPQRGQEIAKVMEAELGVSPEELREATDPRVWIAVDRMMRAEAKAARLEASVKQTKATETALKSQATTPAAKPAGAGAPPRGVSDNLGTKEWMRRRDAQLARKRA